MSVDHDPSGADEHLPDDEDPAVQAEVHVARRDVSRAEKAGQAPAEQPKPGKRQRIVLAERRNSRRVVRTLAELEDQTRVGEALVRKLMWVQLMLSLRLLLLTVVVLAGIPLAFLRTPSLGTVTILGLRLPWLLLGFAVYPFFVAVAWSYNRGATRNEHAFAEWVEN